MTRRRGGRGRPAAGARRGRGAGERELRVDTIAEDLRDRAGLEAEFVCAQVTDYGRETQGGFDIVYASYGAIGWLPSLEEWAGVVARCLRPPDLVGSLRRTGWTGWRAHEGHLEES